MRSNPPHRPVGQGSGAREAPRRRPPELTRDNAEATGLAPNWKHLSMEESVMQALKELFTTDVGLMSVGGIAFMLGMAVFFVRYFIRHMREDEARARR
jgi:hypothetical protein